MESKQRYIWNMSPMTAKKSLERETRISIALLPTIDYVLTLRVFSITDPADDTTLVASVLTALPNSSRSFFTNSNTSVLWNKVIGYYVIGYYVFLYHYPNWGIRGGFNKYANCHTVELEVSIFFLWRF